MDKTDDKTAKDRNLTWRGVWNARDLGGLVTSTGRRLREGALVRSSQLDLVDDAGWKSIEEYGIETLIDLRNPVQRERAPQSTPHAITVIELPLEDGLDADPEFANWMQKGWLCTTLYYPRFLERWPGRCAHVIEAIATAPPGGVLLQCGHGRDRTGLIVALVLSLLDVPQRTIIDDHMVSADRIQSEATHELGIDDDSAQIAEVYRQAGTTHAEALSSFLTELDAASVLSAAGLPRQSIDELRRRLLTQNR